MMVPLAALTGQRQVKTPVSLRWCDGLFAVAA
jgi:hypothetical protein